MGILWILVVFLISISTLADAGYDTQINCCADTDREPCARQTYPTDCQDVRAIWGDISGVYTIYLRRHKHEERQVVQVFCDMEQDSRTAWTVFQRRSDGHQDFYLNWADYEHGFGDRRGEYWLGNAFLHMLTSQRSYTLRIDIENFDGESRHADYSTFIVLSGQKKYQLTVGGYSGDAGNSMSRHNGQNFTTKDQDNDKNGRNCAVAYHGAWWYESCHSSNLNGQYLGGNHSSYADGVNWSHWMGQKYSLKFTEMKLARN